ncbi:MAG: hypothetical protein ACT4UP_06480 [Gammaproteobacteria bacterium]
MRKTGFARRQLTGPGARPLGALMSAELDRRFGTAVATQDGGGGAHCVHELWMRGEPAMNVEAKLALLWERAGASIPDWLPMRYVDWLPQAYQIASRCVAGKSGRTHIYLVLLDYADRDDGPYGIYVGMSRYRAADRFDQHKAGIRAAGSVLRRGMEVLTGPVQHLQFIARQEAARIEIELAEALRAAGLIVKGGH